jgi:hypothetical protein
LLGAVWLLLAWLSDQSGGASIPLSIELATLSAGLVILLAGYIQGGAAALPPVATMATVALVSWALSKQTDHQAAIGIGLVALFGLLMIGRFFGEVSATSALTIFLAPLLCWTTELPPLRRRSGWIIGAIRLLLVAIALAVVLVQAKAKFDREIGPLLR